MPVVFSLPEDGKSTPKYNGACTYLICSPDGTPYVGQTKKFRKRMRDHKSDGKRAWINHAKHQAGKRKYKVSAKRLRSLTRKPRKNVNGNKIIHK